MTDYRPRPIRDSVIQGAVAGLTILVLAVGINVIAGNQQQDALNDIKASARAQVCVLVLPVTDQGRDEAETNSICLIPNGIAPGDWDNDGRVETIGP